MVYFLLLTLSCRQSCDCFLNQDLPVAQCRLHHWRHWCLGHTGSGKRQMLSCVWCLCMCVCVCVCVCVLAWTPTVSGIWRIGTVIWAVLRISHKQMKARSLKVRLISLSELHGEYSEYGEGFLTPGGSEERLLSSLSPPPPHQQQGKKWPGFIFCVHQYSLIHRASWQLKCRQARCNRWARNPLCRSAGDV